MCFLAISELNWWDIHGGTSIVKLDAGAGLCQCHRHRPIAYRVSLHIPSIVAVHKVAGSVNLQSDTQMLVSNASVTCNRSHQKRRRQQHSNTSPDVTIAIASDTTMVTSPVANPVTNSVTNTLLTRLLTNRLQRRHITCNPRWIEILNIGY